MCSFKNTLEKDSYCHVSVILKTKEYKFDCQYKRHIIPGTVSYTHLDVYKRQVYNHNVYFFQINDLKVILAFSTLFNFLQQLLKSINPSTWIPSIIIFFHLTFQSLQSGIALRNCEWLLEDPTCLTKMCIRDSSLCFDH